MKTLFLLLLVSMFLQRISFAQIGIGIGRYRIKMVAFNLNNNNFDSSCDNKFEVYFKFADNTETKVWEVNDISDFSRYETELFYPISTEISSFKIYGERNWKNWFYCNGHSDWSSSKSLAQPCFLNRYTNLVPNWNGKEEYQPVTNSYFIISIQPDALIIRTENPLDILLPTEDPVKILATTGFPASVYNWQFSVDGTTTWRSFPSGLQGLETQELTASQLLEGSGLNVVDYIEKNVQIRLNACDGNALSAPISLKIVKSPPKFFGGDGGITVTPPNCSDSNDGKATITFDRALVDNESLNLTIKVDPYDGLTFYNKQITNNELDANHRYTFPQNLAPKNYLLQYQGIFKYIDASGTEKNSYSNLKTGNTFTITPPSPVTFTYTPVNVRCHNGNDGSITVTAGGGNGSYHYMIKREGQVDGEWKPFSPDGSSHIIPGLEAAEDWIIQIRDGKQCYAKESNGNIISRVVQITEPPYPLVNNLVIKTNPLGYGRADGSITVDVSGGTANAGTYHYQWTNLAGENITSNITANVSGTVYRIVITHLPDGTYTLTTTDNLYSTATATTATSNAGCTDVDSYNLKQPPPLVATITIQDSILCHGNANGSLAAHGKGGVPYTSGLPYIYTWKKKKEKDNVFEVIPNQTDNKIIQTDSTIANLSTGTYAVSIEDGNKIVMEKETTFFFLQPAKLEVNVASTPVLCDGLPKGTATAIASGGTPAYTYTWSNGKTTAAIDALPAGTYLIYVKDYRLCETQKNIEVSQPDAISLSVDRREPTCHNSRDGSLTVTITGGEAPYRYTWTGATSTGPAATNLSSGNYGISIIDAKDCTVLSNYTLNNPPPLPLDLGKDRFICSTQNITYDITIPDKMITYQWGSNNGFSSHNARVVLTKEGTYYAGVTDAKGCNSKDTVVLTVQNTVINNEFALPTQVYQREQIVVVNTSNPQPDSLQWVLPPQAVITQQNNKYAAFTLANTGAYFVKLITYRGRCYAEETKKVIVLTPHNLNSVLTK